MPSTQTINLSDGRGGLWNESFGAVAQTLKVLEDAGFDHELLKRLRAEPEFASRLVQQAHIGAIYESLSQRQARASFGNNFFSTLEWWSTVGVPLSPEHLDLVHQFPWPAEIATQPDPFQPQRYIRGTHIAFPMWTTVGEKDREKYTDINWFYQRFPLLFQQREGSDPTPWFIASRLKGGIKEQASWQCRWYCVRLNPPAAIANMTFENQLANLPEGYQPAPLVVMVAAHIFYRLRYGFFADVNRKGRCSHLSHTFTGDGDYTFGFGQSGIEIEPVSKMVKSQKISLCLMRKRPDGGGK